jgi:endoribonuclease Dicer
MTDMDGQNIQAFTSSDISSFSVNSLPSASMTCHRQSSCIAQLDKAPGAFRDEYEPDTDDEPESSQQEGPTTISNKRRVENAVFKQYASKLAAAFTEKDLKKAFKQSHAEQPLSVKELLAQDESSERITDPRDYQIELFERAKQKNIIAVLETGAGKTHIATLLLRWVLDKELEDRRDGKEHKTAFFLVSRPGV